MHGSRDIEDLYAFYRSPEFVHHGGPQMVRFLDVVADRLQSKLVYFGTSHTMLWLFRVATYDESHEHPAIRIYADCDQFDFAYQESWQDGPYFRLREEHTRCTIEHARAALLEMLARLKAPAA
jgi:hypothetical protein